MLRSTFVFLLMSMIAAGAAAGDWTETVKVNGDLRYRHENIDQEGEEVRNRQRIRARLSLAAELEEGLNLNFRLVSGSDDPVSTNQTLDGAFTTKGIGLDRAFFAWENARRGVEVRGGKMGVPFVKAGKNELIWDGDLSPEGLAASWGAGNDAVSVFANAAGLWIDERSGSENAALMGGQAGMTYRGDGVRFTFGGGLFRYSNLDGALYDGDFFGNSHAGDAFLYEFRLIEVFAEVGFEAGETPVVLYADFVKNNEADDDEQGYIFGAKLNKAKAPGTWAAGYSYRELQADAVMGAFAHSDFAGGGTDNKGHQFNFAYQVAGSAQLALTYLVNTKGLVNGVDYKRLQADMKFAF